MNANIINFKCGVIDKSAKRKEGKIGFLYNWNSKWSDKLLKGIFVTFFIKIKNKLLHILMNNFTETLKICIVSS
jgi:hypothetical protein